MMTYVYFILKRLSTCMTQRLKLGSSVTHGGRYKPAVKPDDITQSQSSTSSNVPWEAVSCGEFTGGCSHTFSSLGCKIASWYSFIIGKT
jgi:hypothetical protein